MTISPRWASTNTSSPSRRRSKIPGKLATVGMLFSRASSALANRTQAATQRRSLQRCAETARRHLTAGGGAARAHCRPGESSSGRCLCPRGGARLCVRCQRCRRRAGGSFRPATIETSLPAAKHAPDGGLRIDQRRVQLLRELLRREYAFEHHLVRPEDLPEFRTKLLFDPTSGCLELRTREVERDVYPSELRLDLRLLDFPKRHGAIQECHPPARPYQSPNPAQCAIPQASPQPCRIRCLDNATPCGSAERIANRPKTAGNAVHEAGPSSGCHC